MTKEEIWKEADSRYPRRWSGDVENGNNFDVFFEGAEWAQKELIEQVHRVLEKVLTKEMLDELVKYMKGE